jgi:hypothetical protein
MRVRRVRFLPQIESLTGRAVPSTSTVGVAIAPDVDPVDAPVVSPAGSADPIPSGDPIVVDLIVCINADPFNAFD